MWLHSLANFFPAVVGSGSNLSSVMVIQAQCLGSNVRQRIRCYVYLAVRILPLFCSSSVRVTHIRYSYIYKLIGYSHICHSLYTEDDY